MGGLLGGELNVLWKKNLLKSSLGSLPSKQYVFDGEKTKPEVYLIMYGGGERDCQLQLE